MSEPAFRIHDGYEFPGDPASEVLIIYRNGSSPKDQPVKASSRRWEWKRSGHEAFDIVKWSPVL